MNSNRDFIFIKHILQYCDRIEKAKARFKLTLEVLEADAEYKDAVSMKVLQIGELATLLSKDFKSANDQIP